MIRLMLFGFCMAYYYSGLAQTNFFEIGLGAKYDHFKIDQSEKVFDQNLDIGATAYISYGRPINEKINWQLGLCTNNYKLNFKVKGPGGVIYSSRELVSVMRSNRLFFNIEHQTARLSQKITWVNQAGVSLLFGSKNPYDVILQRGTEITTQSGTQSILINIQTFGLTGSSILIGAGSKLYFQVNKDFKILAHLGILTGTGELSKVEVNYVEGASSSFKKAIFYTNGFSPYLNFGVHYCWVKDVK